MDFVKKAMEQVATSMYFVPAAAVMQLPVLGLETYQIHALALMARTALVKAVRPSTEIVIRHNCKISVRLLLVVFVGPITNGVTASAASVVNV